MADNDQSTRDETIIPTGGRLLTLDILRGVAILWVVLYHLWAISAQGFRLYYGYPDEYYDNLTSRVMDGRFTAAFTAFTDLIFRFGNNGVTMFMILSGTSLTMVALQSRRPFSAGSFFQRRLHKLIVPYWAALFLFTAFLALLAIYRTHADGGSYTYNFQYMLGARQIDMHRFVASLFILPRVFDVRYFAAPSPTLWFVPLLLQYYLIFPPLLVLLKRIGPLAFSIAAFAVSVGSFWWMSWEYGNATLLWAIWFPFRGFEFAVGMAIGYVLVERPAFARRAVAAWPAVIAIVAVGIVLHTVGSMLDDRDGYWYALGYPVMTAGFAAVMFVVLSVRPGFVLSSAPFRLIAWIGVISYTVLIVNEWFFHMNKYLVISGDQWTAAWWFFVVVLYVPVTVLLAYPLAVVLGLTGKPTWWPSWSLPRRSVPTIGGPEAATGGG